MTKNRPIWSHWVRVRKSTDRLLRDDAAALALRVHLRVLDLHLLHRLQVTLGLLRRRGLGRRRSRGQVRHVEGGVGDGGPER